ncbi:MAG: hypothetical protein GY679_02205 [Mycoplasma sp.]|nr:hypothetical protein [Mycoplasma sp.]
MNQHFKLSKDFFDRSEMKLLDNLFPDGEAAIVLLKLITNACQYDGIVSVSQSRQLLFPKETSMMSTIIGIEKEAVKRVVFEAMYYGLIEKTEEGYLFLVGFVDDMSIGRNKEDGVVYFIGNQEEGNVKIGFSTDVNRRIKELQTSSPSKLKILKTFPGDISKERELHERFKEYRIKGEWFELVGNLKCFIEELQND